MHAVDGDGTVVRVVNGVVAHVRVAHGAYHMEVNAVPADPAHLPRAPHLDILDARGERLALRAVDDRRLAPRMQHDVRPVPIELRDLVALHDNVPAEERHVAPEVHRVALGKVARLAQVIVKYRC